MEKLNVHKHFKKHFFLSSMLKTFLLIIAVVLLYIFAVLHYCALYELIHFFKIIFFTFTFDATLLNTNFLKRKEKKSTDLKLFFTIKIIILIILDYYQLFVLAKTRIWYFLYCMLLYVFSLVSFFINFSFIYYCLLFTCLFICLLRWKLTCIMTIHYTFSFLSNQDLNDCL